MWWALILILGLVALSVIIGGGINTDFLLLLLIFLIGVVVAFAIKKLWDNFRK